jgi:hypothetical protein
MLVRLARRNGPPFTGSTGMLRLDHSSTFSGTIFKFTGNGKLSGSDQIDLKDIKYSSVHDSYANNVLTVTDGSGDAAKLHFNGSYTLANFKFANDGSGGTIVYDPPATPSSGQNSCFWASCAIGNDWEERDARIHGPAWHCLQCTIHTRLFSQ